ncbi:MAG TPA: adenylate/guanylate cyclase domain-containing protein [Casimicrobiaceae bacterium]|nr:adenylate/guanylate cyclase domain-containing protein [Casimicrobiaceae bacterium]
MAFPTVASALTCVVCGTELPHGAKFCPECAHPVAAPEPADAREGARPSAPYTALEGERKLVTVLFADLKGSLELIADRDPEEARRLLDPVVEHMCEAVEKYGGTVSQVMGDGILALFGAPVSWEDHAVRACYAALSMQDLVRHYGDDIQRVYGFPVQIRIGLNSGEVVLNVSGRGLYMSYIAVGRTVHVAARMEQMAKPGSVLATAETVRLAEGYVEARLIGPVSVKGMERPVEVAEISRAAMPRSRFDRAPARAMTPFLGREAELAKLLQVFDDVALRREGRIAVVVGEAGIGKSRLVHEFLRIVLRRDALALDGGGAPYSSGAGYRPGVHILRQYFNIADLEDVRAVQEKVAGRILALDGDANEVGVPILALMRALPLNHRFFDLTVAERRQRVFTALMWLGRRMAAERPLVLAYEDLQWVTSDTRDFLDAFARETPPSTLALLTYRSDYDASWLMDKGHVAIRLDGLPPVATRRIISDLLGDDPSLAALKDELPRQSGGNPLFIEEYVRNMVDSVELIGQPGHYRMGARREATTIPPTVRAVLAARIDRLARLDKHVLQTLAAVGDVATVALLERVSDISTDELRKSLRRLERAGLLVERIDREQLAYEFKHSLTQAVAYETLLHQRRRELHLGILGALSDTQEYDVLARHAEQGEAWEQALTYLREAGRLTAQLGGLEAVSYFERALNVLQRLPHSAHSLETAFDLHCELRNALVPLGQHARLLEVLKSAEKLAKQIGDERRLAQAYSFLSNYYGNVGQSDAALEAGERSLVLGERVGATDLLLVGNMSAGEIYRTLGNYQKARTFLMRAVLLIEPEREQEHVGQVGLPAVRARSHLAWTLAELGDFPGARMVAAEAMRVADASNHPYSVCHGCLGLGGTRVRQGEFDAAIGVLARGFATSEHVPLLRPPIAADLGLAYARCGRLAEGLSHLDAAVEGATKMGRFSRLPLLLVKCGEIHLLAGERDEALRLATRALELATEQKERGNRVYATHLLAEIAAQREGASAEAERHYLDALALASELGMRPLSAHCHAGLARLYAATDQAEKSAEHWTNALFMYREMAMWFWVERLEKDD